MVEQEIIVKQIRNDDDTLNMMIMGKLVRCKDCKFYYRMTAETGICQLACPHFGNDGFCSEGERKDGNDD